MSFINKRSTLLVRWSFLLSVILVLSCNKGGPILSTRPAGVLSKSQMVEVLVDINLAESALRVGNPVHNQSYDSIYQKSQFIKVFEKNNISPDNFDKSLSYYSEHIDDLNDIYSDVLERLSDMQAKLEGNKNNSQPQTIQKAPSAKIVKPQPARNEPPPRKKGPRLIKDE